MKSCWLACSRHELLDSWVGEGDPYSLPWAWDVAKPPELRAASEWDDRGHESFGERLERNGFWKSRNERARHHKGVFCPRTRTALLVQVPESMGWTKGHFQKLLRNNWEGLCQDFVGHIHVHRTRFKLQHGEVWLGRGGREECIAEGGSAALLQVF